MIYDNSVEYYYFTSLPGLLSPPKCYNCFTLGSRPLMPHYLGELMAFQVK